MEKGVVSRGAVAGMAGGARRERQPSPCSPLGGVRTMVDGGATTPGGAMTRTRRRKKMKKKKKTTKKKTAKAIRFEASYSSPAVDKDEADQTSMGGGVSFDSGPVSFASGPVVGTTTGAAATTTIAGTGTANATDAAVDAGVDAAADPATRIEAATTAWGSPVGCGPSPTSSRSGSSSKQQQLARRRIDAAIGMKYRDRSPSPTLVTIVSTSPRSPSPQHRTHRRGVGGGISTWSSSKSSSERSRSTGSRKGKGEAYRLGALLVRSPLAHEPLFQSQHQQRATSSSGRGKAPGGLSLDPSLGLDRSDAKGARHPKKTGTSRRHGQQQGQQQGGQQQGRQQGGQQQRQQGRRRPASANARRGEGRTSSKGGSMMPSSNAASASVPHLPAHDGFRGSAMSPSMRSMMSPVRRLPTNRVRPSSAPRDRGGGRGNTCTVSPGVAQVSQSLEYTLSTIEMYDSVIRNQYQCPLVGSLGGHNSPKRKTSRLYPEPHS